MAIKKIVVNIESKTVGVVRQFYLDLFDLDVSMDLGWIVMLSTGDDAAVQINIASEGGSGTPVPDISIEVENVDAVFARAEKMGCPIEYGLTDEPWGLRRFYLRDPAGKLVNVAMHL